MLGLFYLELTPSTSEKRRQAQRERGLSGQAQHKSLNVELHAASFKHHAVIEDHFKV